MSGSSSLPNVLTSLRDTLLTVASLRTAEHRDFDLLHRFALHPLPDISRCRFSKPNRLSTVGLIVLQVVLHQKIAQHFLGHQVKRPKYIPACYTVTGKTIYFSFRRPYQ